LRRLRYADRRERVRRRSGASERDPRAGLGYDPGVTVSPLAREVLALPYAERERLLSELLDSLHDGHDAGALAGEGWDHAWAAELDARMDEVAAGTVTTVPADQVLAEMRAGVVPARR
jgi:putative addiction module component (TIGR02574 family)